jgi:hypothetical protein
MTAIDTADYLGRSDTWFREHLGELYAQGFPRPLALFSSWDRRAVDLWLDRIGSIESPSAEAEADAWLRAAGGG